MMNPMQKVDVLRAACCVAGIDGQPNNAERVVIDKLAGEAGVGQASLNAMIDRGATDPEFHREQFCILKAQPQKTMAALLEVAMADGHLSENETNVLRALSEKLSVPTNVFEQLLSNINNMLE